MNSKQFLKAFIEDSKYYDLEKIELKNILKNVDVKNKRILDIGAGIGRLAFPLAKYAKEVVALDKDKRFSEYYKKHKSKKVKFVNQSIQQYSKIKDKFDIIILAWPVLNIKFIRLIKKLMNKGSLLIFITCKNDSDYEENLSELTDIDFKEQIKNKINFLDKLSREFYTIKKKQLTTYYRYPNEKIAFRINKNALLLWFDTKADKETEKELNKSIKMHKKGNKIIFKEKIYFYVLKWKL